MENRDIRDIAAYYGVRCSYVEDAYWHMCPLDGIILDDLSKSRLSDFKLILRPISSLTDEEIIECAKIDVGGEFIYGGVYEIRRTDLFIQAYYSNGAAIQLGFDHLVDEGFASAQIIEIVSYLQSIGVYVPGAIDEKYVQLI